MINTLATKYRPQNFEDVTSQSDTISILKYQLENNKIKNAYLFSGASGCGKSLRMGTKIFTNLGWVCIQNLDVNVHKILGDDGLFHDLKGIYPQGLRRMYRIYLEGGIFSDCDIEHIWSVVINKNSCRTNLKLSEIIDNMNKGIKCKIPISSLNIDKNVIENNIPLDLFVLVSKCGYCYNYNDNTVYTITVFNKHEREFLHTICKKYNLYYDLAESISGRFMKKGTTYLIYGYDLNKIPIDIWKGDFNIPDCILLLNNTEREKLIELYLSIASIYSMADNNSIYCKVLNSKNKNFLLDLQNIFHLSGYKTTFIEGSTNQLIIQLKKQKNIFLRIKKIVDLEIDDYAFCLSVDTENHLFTIWGGLLTHNTTVARIFSNQINKGLGMPIELDAASNNGIDDVRNIIEESRYKSITSEYKVFIIDECHSITSQGWQAFLKILEEPPKKVVFIFCTTEPHRLPKTILNRLQRYDFYRMQKDHIIKRLKYILENEKIENYEIEALEYIARISFGGMRDAITYLDKILISDNDLTLENVLKILSLCDYSIMFDIVNNLNNCKVLLEIVDKIFLEGKSLKNFIETLIQFTIDYIKIQSGLNFDSVSIPITYCNYKYDSVVDMKDFLIKLIKLNTIIKYESNIKMLVDAFFIEVSNNEYNRSK